MHSPSRRLVLKGVALSGATAMAPQLVGADAGRPRVQQSRQPESGRDWFVDPDDGNDDWAGHHPEPGDGDAGPLATIHEALTRAYEEAADLEDDDADRMEILIWLRGGRYPRSDPIEIGSHGTDRSITIAAHPEERPLVDGSRELTGWEEIEVNGVTAWKTTIDSGYFRSLFVDGERRPRPRLPSSVDEVFEDGQQVTDDEERFYHFADAPDEEGATTFTAEEGSIDPDWRNLSDVNVVTIDRWYDERSTIDSFDPDTREVTLTHRPYPEKPWPGRFYYVENVFEALSEPGEWYLDRGAGECYYVPREDETIDDTSIRVPRTRKLLEVEGEVGEPPVTNLTFSGVTFGYTAWRHLQDDPKTTTQSAVPAVPSISFSRAANCSLEECTIQSPGEYGIGLERDTKFIDVVGCEIADMGAGGVKVLGSITNRRLSTGKHRIADNHIHDGGRVFHMGAGILSTKAPWMTISHNHIHDLYYTGISCGFEWTFGGIADYNQIEHNHIHHLGQGLLSDMGGVYTLGKQQSTEVRNNHIHHVVQNDYGGWGLYPDQGSTGILWAENLVHDVQNGFHLHYGANNRIHNNILTDNREAAIAYSNSNTASYEYGLRVHNNVLVTDGSPIFTGGYDWSIDQEGVESDRNLVWNRAGAIDATDTGTIGSTELKVVDVETGEDVSGSTVSVDLSGDDLGTFQFADLEESIELDANTRYRVVMAVSSGGPKWYNPVEVTTTDAATAVGSTWYSNNEGSYQDSDNGKSFGPVNLKYTVDGGEEQSLVTSNGTDADLRNNYSGHLGMMVEVGDEPITVTALGRYVPEGALPAQDSWWDTWREMGRDANSVLEDPRFVDPASDDFTLESDSAALEDPVNFEPLDLSTVGPRPETPPAPPTGVSASIEDGVVSVEWDAIQGASGYRVARSSTDGEDFETIAERTETSYLDTGVGAGTYYYVVTSLGDGNVESVPSAQATAEIAAPTATETPAVTPTTNGGGSPATASPTSSGITSTGTDTDTPTSPGFGAVTALLGLGLAGWRLLRGDSDTE